jgi:O-antigen ligase
VPTLISIWVMGSMAIVFILQSGVTIGGLRIWSRAALLPLGAHPNELGRLYAVAYALLLFTWAELKTPVLRWTLLVSMGLVIVALILTLSRGGFLCFIVINVLFLLWRRNAKTLIFLGLLTAVALFLLPGAVYDRIMQGTRGYGSGFDEISSGRITAIWLPLLPEILRSPIYGSGLGSIMWSEAMREGTALGVAQAHSAYLETVLDMGIAGLILVCAYFAHVWRGFRALSVDPAVSPTLRGFYLGAAAGLAGLLAGGISAGYLTPAPDQVFLWLAIGMMYGQRARKTGDVSISRQHVQAGIPTQPA